MLRHAVTVLVVVVLGAALTFLFATRGYNAETDPNSDINEALVVYKRCTARLSSLNSELGEALADDAHRAERFAAVLSPAETACTEAETALQNADRQHPGDPTVAAMRRKLKPAEDWLRDLSTAFAAYEVAAKSGPAAKELAALQALLH